MFREHLMILATDLLLTVFDTVVDYSCMDMWKLSMNSSSW